MNQKENRPRILIIGHGRHGKDTVAEYLRDKYDLRFYSSSDFVGKKCIWPVWGKERYDTYDDMFADRVNHRHLWSNLISAYNTPDKARTAREMLQEEGADMYVGMRKADEFDACIKENLFTHILWVDASDRHPPEPNPSMEMKETMATHRVSNNENIEHTYAQLDVFVKVLVSQGYHWGGSPLDAIHTPAPKDDESVDMWYPPEKAIEVLDQGYVLFVDKMGDDQAIADAARLSYGRGTKQKRDPEGLINYLWSNRHTSPFEMAEIKLQIRMPIFVMRQWVRHRTANLNEYSGRYSVMPRMWYTPGSEDIKSQNQTNKQASGELLEDTTQETASRLIWEASNRAFNDYEKLLSMGVSREMARIILPLNTYTEVVWKMDLKNLLDFIRLRNDPHAQPEIQAYAKVIEDLIQEHFPLSYKAYLDQKHRFNLNIDQILKLLTGSTEIELSKRDQMQMEAVMKALHEHIPNSGITIPKFVEK